MSSKEPDLSILDEIPAEIEAHLSPLGKTVLAALRWLLEKEGKPG